MILERIVVGPFQTNCYLLAREPGAPGVLIDPGDQKHRIQAALQKEQITPVAVMLTHGHIDHIGCADAFGVPVLVHSADQEMLHDPRLNLSALFSGGRRVSVPVEPLADGAEIQKAHFCFTVIHTPGHTPGGVCFFTQSPEGPLLFSGDTLFYRSIGRSDFPGADGPQLVRAIRQRLLVLPPQTRVLPGHGPETSIAQEAAQNPFLGDE